MRARLEIPVGGCLAGFVACVFGVEKVRLARSAFIAGVDCVANISNENLEFWWECG